jgi:hypothetical protein
MGTYAILDQDRKNRLQAGSISHKSEVQANADNQQTIKDTRHAANYDIKKLEAEQAENLKQYRGKNNNYKKSLYDSIKADLDQKIKDYNTYYSAIAAQKGLKQTVNSGGGDVVTNPLLDNVAKLIANGQTNLVVMAFYLAVTVLLEWAAYTLGGRVEAIDVYIQNVESHIADLTNMRVFGMSMKQVNLDVAKGAIHSQRQRIQFDKEMKRAVLEQTDEDGKSLSLDETNSYVDGLKKKASGLGASGDSTVDSSKASDLDLEGYTLDELTNRRDEYKKAPEGSRLCPACHAQVPNVKGQFYCTNSNHQAEFNNQLKRLKRAK